MQTNQNPSEAFSVVGAIDPDAYAAGTYTSGWVDMADFESVMALVCAGDLGANATLDAKIEQATSSGGAGAKNLGKAITQMTAAGTDSNKQSIINVRGSELDINNGYRYVRLSMTIGTAASDAGGYVFGFNAKNGTGEENNAAAVKQVIA